MATGKKNSSTKNSAGQASAPVASPCTYVGISALLKEDFMRGAAAAQRRYSGTRVATWETSANAFEAARILAASAVKRKTFYAHEFWKGGSERNPEKILLHSHQFFYGARIGPESDRAEEHARALAPFFKKNDVSADDVLSMLKEGGGFAGLHVKPQKDVQSRTVRPTSKASTKNARVAAKRSSRQAAPSPSPTAAPTQLTVEELLKKALPVAMDPKEILWLNRAQPDEVPVITLGRIEKPVSKYVLWEAVKIDY